jgi:hypothetical protein
VVLPSHGCGFCRRKHTRATTLESRERKAGAQSHVEDTTVRCDYYTRPASHYFDHADVEAARFDGADCPTPWVVQLNRRWLLRSRTNCRTAVDPVSCTTNSGCFQLPALIRPRERRASRSVSTDRRLDSAVSGQATLCISSAFGNSPLRVVASAFAGYIIC